MSKIVRVKVVETDTVKTMTEDVAIRLAKASPNKYIILEAPKIEVTSLPPIKKKDVEHVEHSLGSIGQNIPSNEKTPEQVTTTQTTEEFTRKRGRPKTNI